MFFDNSAFLNRDNLSEIIRSRIVTKRLVNRSIAAEPNWKIEFHPLEPDERTIRTLLREPRERGSLLGRVARA